jgi:hypothetical protein
LRTGDLSDFGSEIPDLVFLIGGLIIIFGAKKAKRQNVRSVRWKAHGARPTLTVADLASGTQPYLNPKSAIHNAK